MIKLILIVVALVAGYMLFSRGEQEKVVEQKVQREEQIMEKQQEFMEQNKDLGKQLQDNADNRMQE